MANFHALKINSIIKETRFAVRLGFYVPDDLKSVYKFKAGQYLTLKTKLSNSEVRRDYSLCTDPQTEDLQVVVKAVSGGVFSEFANSTLKEGDVLEVAPPNGRFIFEPDQAKSRTIVAFAAGSGITPVIGIIRTVLNQEPNSKVVLVYGNKSPEETIFYDALEQLSAEHPDRFQMKLVFSQANEENALFGRIDQSVLNYTLNQFIEKHPVDDFYLCGPEKMILELKEALIEKSYGSDSIHFELFTPSTETSSKVQESIQDGKSSVTVIVDDEESSFVMSSSKTILEVALENNIDAPYSCQGGICSSCLARLVDGEVVMRQNNILTDSEVAEGLILTCQSQPTTPIIKVDYDDV